MAPLIGDLKYVITGLTGERIMHSITARRVIADALDAALILSTGYATLTTGIEVVLQIYAHAFTDIGSRLWADARFTSTLTVPKFAVTSLPCGIEGTGAGLGLVERDASTADLHRAALFPVRVAYALFKLRTLSKSARFEDLTIGLSLAWAISGD